MSEQEDMASYYLRRAKQLLSSLEADQEADQETDQEADQPWRTEPEVDKKRQEYLAKRRLIIPNIEKGIYPFKGEKLSRADVEWLLATHESRGMRGAVDWNDERQQQLEGLDLRGADLRDAQLQKVHLSDAQLQKADLLNAQLQGAILMDAQLQGANLINAPLQKANLYRAQLQGADLWNAQLQGANLRDAQLQGADLRDAQLQGADLYRSDLEDARLDGVKLSDETYGSVLLADVMWGNVNLTVVDWGHVTSLGNEQKAHQKRKNELGTRVDDYKEAVRAYRQLSVVLHNQGLNEDAARFAYRGQLMQRKVVWYQGFRSFGQYLFSLFLDLLTGYGYKPIRSFITYAVVISVFAFLYFLLGPHLAWNEAIVISMTAFHGRGFFPEQFHPGDPQALVAALEAFVGLLIEVTFIATLTQRLFSK